MSSDAQILAVRLDSAHQTLSAIKTKINTPPPGNVPAGQWVQLMLRDIVDACDAELNGPPLVLETPEQVIDAS